jgi:hypothetical protein
MNKHIPEGDIEIVVVFLNDASVGMPPVYYTLQAPDFRRDWTEGEHLLKLYIAEKRKQIQELYAEFGGEVCRVHFSFEQPDEMIDILSLQELHTELHTVLEHCKDLILHGHSIQAIQCYKEYTGCGVSQAIQTLGLKLPIR